MFLLRSLQSDSLACRDCGRTLTRPRYLSASADVSAPVDAILYSIAISSARGGFLPAKLLEKEKAVAKMLLPVEPVMASGEDLEGVGDCLLHQRSMQFPVVFEQSIVQSAV